MSLTKKLHVAYGLTFLNFCNKCVWWWFW